VITRRTALKRLGAIAGAAAIGPKATGCGDNQGPPPTAARGITHLVEVCMENRSFDHLLGARALLGAANAGDGLGSAMQNPRTDGTLVKVFPTDTMCVADPPHSWAAAHAQWNDGAMDGFLRQYEATHGDGIAPEALGYLTGAHIPWTWALADGATVCDRWFCSLLGPTWPNRLYLHSGQSNGLSKNEVPPEGFNWPTIYHRLNDKGVKWRYYFSDLPVAGLWKDLVSDETTHRLEQFFDDAAAGTLPPVSVVEPAFTANDDHPPHHPLLGQQFLASIYAALAASPQWPNLLLVITYDEHGGFFDHVAPPTAIDDRAALGFDQLGVRVPTIVAGPYARAGALSSVVRDHASLPRHIGRMFDLTPLTQRDAHAADLSECLDADRLAAFDPAPPRALPAIEVDESMIDEACYKRGARYADYVPCDFERLADTGFFGAHDRRRHVRDTLDAIGEVLDRHDAGRIRRGR
jgi:phospholipase C